MTATNDNVNRPAIAPLRNVTMFLELVERQLAQPPHIDRLGVFSGPSGYGKTQAAVYAANRHAAYYVECGYSWTQKTFTDAVLHELSGHSKKGSVADKVQEVIRVLAVDPRPLIVDESDHLVKKSIIDIVREIHDKTMTPIILIGEEELPNKLAEFERAHNRVSSWVLAQPTDIADARELAGCYCRDVEIEDALLEEIVERTYGVTRRVVANLQQVLEESRKTGNRIVTLADFDPEKIVTGNPPRRKAPARRKAA